MLAQSIILLKSIGLIDIYQPTLQPSEDTQPTVRMEWDEQRWLILQECGEKYLLPSLELELRRELLRVSKEYIVSEAALNFSKMLSVGPYRKKNISSKNVLESCPQRACPVSVVAIMTSSEKHEPLFMAYVDKDGLLRRHDLVPGVAWNQRREKLTEFLRKTTPDVIVVNASGGPTSSSIHAMIQKYLVAEINNSILFEARRKIQERRNRNDFNRYEDEEDEFIKFEPEVREFSECSVYILTIYN